MQAVRSRVQRTVRVRAPAADPSGRGGGAGVRVERGEAQRRLGDGRAGEQEDQREERASHGPAP